MRGKGRGRVEDGLDGSLRSQYFGGTLPTLEKIQIDVGLSSQGYTGAHSVRPVDVGLSQVVLRPSTFYTSVFRTFPR